METVCFSETLISIYESICAITQKNNVVSQSLSSFKFYCSIFSPACPATCPVVDYIAGVLTKLDSYYKGVEKLTGVLTVFHLHLQHKAILTKPNEFALDTMIDTAAVSANFFLYYPHSTHLLTRNIISEQKSSFLY